MNVFRKAAVAAVAVAALGTGGAMLAASAASAAPAPPTHHTLVSTGLQFGRTQMVGPQVSITRSTEYSAIPTAPGFARSGALVEVCFQIPHIIPPGPLTPLAFCNWQLSGLRVPFPGPQNTLHGTALLNGLGSVGRVNGGTGIWRGAFSLLPNQTTFTNLAPRTQADVFNFFLPAI